MKILNHIPELRAMAKRGLITLSPDTGRKVKHWTGQIVTACYISEGPREFTYKGKKYGIRYFDGCFNPFVVCLNEDSKNKPSFV